MEIFGLQEHSEPDVVCVALAFTWRKDHIDLINCESVTRKNGSITCTGVVQIQRLERNMAGEEFSIT